MSRAAFVVLLLGHVLYGSSANAEVTRYRNGRWRSDRDGIEDLRKGVRSYGYYLIEFKGGKVATVAFSPKESDVPRGIYIYEYNDGHAGKLMFKDDDRRYNGGA